MGQDCKKPEYTCPIDDQVLLNENSARYRCPCCRATYGLPDRGEKMDEDYLKKWARGYLVTLDRQIDLVREPELKIFMRGVLRMGVEKGLILVDVSTLEGDVVVL